MKRTSALRVADRYLLLKTGASQLRISGSNRGDYLDQVWSMYEKTYRNIGLHISSPVGLLKYDVWELEFNSDGEPVAFSLFKSGPFGLKAGLSGHDFSSEGKRAAIKNLRSKYKQPGVYGEVSHKVKSIALAAGSPVICAAYADDVTGKRIEIIDPITYERNLKGVGNVQKTMVGRPKGVPTTNEEGASCPLYNVDLGDLPADYNRLDYDKFPPGARNAGKAPSLLSWGEGLTEEEEESYDVCSHCSDEAMSSLI